MTIKKIIAILAAMTLAASMLTGCGKKGEEKSEQNNIIPKASSQQNDSEESETKSDESSRPEKQFEVVLDERSEEEKYQYSIDDLSLVDTVTGKKISVGMKLEEVEAIAGNSLTDDKNYRVYDGLIVQFSDEGNVVSMIASGGMFPNAEQATRYMSVRGVGINTSFEDFAKAYGDLYNEASGNDSSGNSTPANAMRYFKVDGDKVAYLGETLSDDLKAEAEKKQNIFVQYFMFEKETNIVSAMRISRYDYLGK